MDTDEINSWRATFARDMREAQLASAMLRQYEAILRDRPMLSLSIEDCAFLWAMGIRADGDIYAAN